MDFLLQSLVDALRLIARGDADVVQAVWASLRFSLASTALASLLGVPAGAALAHARGRWQRLTVTALDTMLALPTVVVGLLVFAVLCRQGPAGSLGLLFTPWAVIVGQTVLILPLVTALGRSAVAQVDPLVHETARTLGAGRLRMAAAVLGEARTGIAAAVATAYGRVIGEVGVSMMLGGNIAHFTRTITTVIALETRKGEFSLALALGIVLLAVALGVNVTARTLAGAAR